MNPAAPAPAPAAPVAWLEFILPLREPAEGLGQTVAALLGQTERGFTVRLCPAPGNRPRQAAATAAAALQQAGIPVPSTPAPAGLSPLELYNWAHDQGRAEWLKPLLSGDELHPDYVARLAGPAASPTAQVVWCGYHAGAATIHRPGTGRPPLAGRLAPAEFLRTLEAGARWLGGPANLAYRRTAWRALGGVPPALPAEGVRLLAAELALHFGLELLPETLATHAVPSTEPAAGRANATAESRLVLRSLQNWCRTAKLEWPAAGLAWTEGWNVPRRLV